MAWLYSIFIRLYVLGIRAAAIRNKKAAEWIRGRKDVFEKLEREINDKDKTIWIHCASAGELEQGKPLIEALKSQYPFHRIVISFFSPSGYQVAQKYTAADVITYLPADTRSNAKRFIELVHPDLVVFVKYEFWFHHISAAAFKHIPILLISAIFRKDQVFFKWHGKFFRQILFLFRQIFVQDANSATLLEDNQIMHCTVAGDTRFDRVKKIATDFKPLDLIATFKGGNKMIVAGSTWPGDEQVLSEYAKKGSTKFIIAPHDINETHLSQVKNYFPNSILYSQLLADPLLQSQVLIIDNIGMLSRLYHYSDIAYIGGGFNRSGIHNTLEAAVYGKPVIFGPNFQKFREARELVAKGGAFSISNEDELAIKMDELLTNPQQWDHAADTSMQYVNENTGATQKMLEWIQANRLLTR
jgi:3-deoxy-D-manno-octulosonic-acid transferase